MSDEPFTRVSRRSLLGHTATAGLLTGSGIVASSLPTQTDTDAPVTGHWLVETGLDEELTAVTTTGDELVAVGNRTADGDVADPTTALHSDSGLVVARIDTDTGNVAVETPASPFDDREFAISDAATNGETVAVVGHAHDPERVAGVRLDVASATVAGWQFDGSSLIERPRLFWVGGELVHVWQNRAYGHLSVSIAVRSSDGRNSVSHRLTEGDPWYCRAFAADGDVFVTEYSDPPRLGTVNRQTGTISWDRTLRSCDGRPTPAGEIGFEYEDRTLYWYRQREDGTSTRGEVLTDYDSTWRLDFASMPDGAVLLASGRTSDEEMASTHLLRVTEDGLQWHERFADPNSHYAGRTVESLPGGRYAVAGIRGTDALDGWLLVTDRHPTDLPEATTVRPRSTETTTTPTEPTTPTPVETLPATPTPDDTPTSTPKRRATTGESPTATPAETTGTAGESGSVLSTGGIATLAALAAGGVQYLRRSAED